MSRVPPVRVAKTFEFHAAHQLPNHEGQCRRMHGHTYRLEIVVSGTPSTESAASDEGMVLDFERIKEFYKSKIEPLVEHQNLNVTLASKMTVTTAENIALWIASELLLAVTWGEVTPECVRLWETPTSWVEVEL